MSWHGICGPNNPNCTDECFVQVDEGDLIDKAYDEEYK